MWVHVSVSESVAQDFYHHEVVSMPNTYGKHSSGILLGHGLS